MLTPITPSMPSAFSGSIAANKTEMNEPSTSTTSTSGRRRKGKGNAELLKLPIDVCKRFDGIIKSQQALLYRIALEFERYIDAPTQVWNPFLPSLGTSTEPTAPQSMEQLTSHQKLQRLRRHCRAWRGEVAPGLKTSIPITRNDSIYELNGGIFALGDVHGAGAGGAWGRHENLQEGARLDFVRLPSIIKEDLEPEWGYIQVGTEISVVDFTMDVEIDMLVLIENGSANNTTNMVYRLHLLSLSRSVSKLEPHPLAHAPILELPLHPDWMDYQVGIAIYGDHLGFLLSSNDAVGYYDRLAVWDWRHGGMAIHYAAADAWDSFVFLEEGRLLIPSLPYTTLDLVAYTLSDPATPLDVNDPSGFPAIGSFTILMSFKLPAVQAGLGYYYIIARSQPTGISSRKNAGMAQGPYNPSQTPSNGVRDTENYNDSSPTRNPFNVSPTPFAPSFEESIIVVSTRVGYITQDDNELNPGRQVRDGDGTLVFTRGMIQSFWELEEAEKEQVLEEQRTETPPVEWGSQADNSTAVGAEPQVLGDESQPDGEEEPLYSPTYRSTGVQTTIESHLSDHNSSHRSGSSQHRIVEVPWDVWMYKARWLRGLGSPRWVRDVHGTRMAARIKDRPALFATSRLPLSSDISEPSGSLIHPYLGPADLQLALNMTMLAGRASIMPPSIPSQVRDGLQLYPASALEKQFTSISPPPPPPIPPVDLSLLPLNQEGHHPISHPSLPQGTQPDLYRTRIFEFNGSCLLGSSESLLYPRDPEQTLNKRGDEAQGEEDEEIPMYRNSPVGYRGWPKTGVKWGPDWICRIMREETFIKRGRTYAEDIRTGLPFLEITSTHSTEPAALMMDAERVIGMKTDNDGNLTSLEVVVL